MENIKQKWLEALGTPKKGASYGKAELISSFSHEEFDAEIYMQENSVGKHQRVLMIFPKEIKEPLPAVAVPFYFPEGMLGFDPLSGEVFERYKGIAMMLDLVRRGYITASAEAYHLSYIKSDKKRDDFSRWQDAADALLKEEPQLTGMGKLFYDTELLVDLLYNDRRVIKNKIGIAGHSLGGKMAFYTGCLDERISCILASDFGIGWDQTNWRDDWYWSGRVNKLIEQGMDHSELLSIASPKPFFLIAGEFDTDESYTMMKKASGYEAYSDRLCFLNHRSGHFPPADALEEGYAFIDKWLKK